MEAKLLALIDGTENRQEVAAWAMQWVDADDPGVEDPAVWEALGNLAGADAISTDRPYLFEVVDFQAWLDELRSQ